MLYTTYRHYGSRKYARYAFVFLSHIIIFGKVTRGSTAEEKTLAGHVRSAVAPQGGHLEQRLCLFMCPKR